MQVKKIKNYSEIHQKYTGIAETADGSKFWYLNGLFHRENGPAREYANGEKHWYLNGKHHREDGPAIEYSNGTKYWYLNGICHRVDGPAIEYSNGSKEWYLNGERHREDGPAIERADGSKSWWLNGNNCSEAKWKVAVEKLKKEREEADKPKLQEIEVESSVEIPTDFTGLVKYTNGSKEWYLNGELHREDGPAVESADGTKFWYLNGELHREDGPAVESADGTKFWYLNGELHREDGPAIERADGYKAWWLNGKCHREDGPAIERASGDKEWYLNDRKYSEAEWKVAVEKLNKEREGANKPKLQEIEVEYLNQVPKGFTGLAKHKNGNKYWFLNGKSHREDGPACEYSDGTKEWFLNGKSHREDGPAIEYADGRKEWYLNDKLHRENGPAVEYSDGSKRWHWNDMYHRVDGPAIEDADGSKEWWLNGERHREDGPAIEYADGSKSWWLNGKYYSEAEWLAAKSVPQKTGEPALTETVASRTMEPSQPVVNKTTETNDKPANGEKNKMSTMENIKEIAVSDAKVVAYRVAASQIGKVMTNAVIKLLSGNMKGKQLAGFRKNMTEFFQTPLGEALLMFMIGCATPFFIKYVPEKYRAHALKVAEAARHEAEFIAASKLMDSFMPILSMAGSGMFSALEGLVSSSEEEEIEKIRVSPAIDNASERHEELSVSSPSARRAVG